MSVRAACLMAALVAMGLETCLAAPPADDVLNAAATAAQGPPTFPLPVRVVDESGKPVAGAKVTPWALRSSQGHGLWLSDTKRRGIDPQAVTTDADGKATVIYPQYADFAEKVKTIEVSLSVDHPDYPIAGETHIGVPLESSPPYEMRLSAGARLTVRPLLDGQPTDLEDIHVRWSDPRSWKVTSLEKLEGGALRLTPLTPGRNSVLVVKLDGERATHFSKLTEIELAAGEEVQLDLPLVPSARIEGKLSDAVPRPVKDGRVKLRTLPPRADDYDRVDWSTWAPVDADGNFVIDGWPAEEAIQLIALCEGFYAPSGSPPAEVKQYSSHHHPQVFRHRPGEPIVVEMSPLSRCVVTVLDDDEHPVAGVKVYSGPNVGWWHGGSQIYCRPLVRYEKLLHGRDYQAAADKAIADPFRAVTDAEGKATLELLPGRERLSVASEVYELPVFLGRRDVNIKLAPNATVNETLHLQPRGTEQLGEWDKLAGVVFGCSTREGRRICALPGVTKKMDEFAVRFRLAKSRRDPALLAEAYTVVADAFAGVGDEEEAASWRKKAAEQAALAAAQPTNKK